MIDREQFRKTLIQCRNAAGLSQSRFAALLCVSGQAVSKWETGASLPDIELLPDISCALGISVDALIRPHSDIPHRTDPEHILGQLSGFDLSDGDARLLAAVSPELSRKQLYKLAKLAEKQTIHWNLSLDAEYVEGEKTHRRQRALDISVLPLYVLEALAQPLSTLAMQVVNRCDHPVKELLPSLRCPACGEALSYEKIDDAEALSCGAHHYPIIDGVIDFGTLEERGNSWSSWIRSYEDYRQKRADAMAGPIPEAYWLVCQKMKDAIIAEKPEVIVDIGSGMGSFVGELVREIDWPCTVVLTDISHRILKYDKMWFEEAGVCGRVNLVYLACDVRKLPFADGSLECVTSFGGYENVHGSIRETIGETYRALRSGGWLIGELAMVERRDAPGTQKWLQLIREYPDPELLARIFDMDEWGEMLRQIGFTDRSIIKMHGEMPPPDTSVFPYKNEIMRWMATCAVLCEK